MRRAGGVAEWWGEVARWDDRAGWWWVGVVVVGGWRWWWWWWERHDQHASLSELIAEPGYVSEDKAMLKDWAAFYKHKDFEL